MDTKQQLNQLATQNKWREILALIEQIPEAERNMDIIGQYVRALNNTGQFGRAVAVSWQYAEQGKDDALWHYRLGYAYVKQGDNDGAEKVLLRGKELATGDDELTRWIDGLLKGIEQK
jgi:Flp pilus assembly protein TadD